MDLSALESAVKALEASLDSVEVWITVSTVLVVLGLVVEYWFPLCDLIESIKRRPPFPWKLLLEMAGGVLVTVGVAGELWFQSRASSIQTLIRSDSHQIEALLNKEADDARLQTTLLRAAMADRNLSPDQQRAMRDVCMASPWKGYDVWIRSYPNDGEADRLIVEIMAALKPCLKFEDRRGQPLGTGTVIGIRVDPGRDRRFAEFLINSLSDKEKGNLSVNDLTPFGGGETTEIMVGLKPAALAQLAAKAADAHPEPSRRVLDAAEEKRLKDAISLYSGRSVDIVVYPADPEIADLKNQLSKIFISAGWHPYFFESTDSGVNVSDVNPKQALDPVSGILVSTDSKDRTADDVARVIIAALPRRFGIQGPSPNRFLNAYMAYGSTMSKSIRVTIGKPR